MIRFDDLNSQCKLSMSLTHIENLSKHFKILNRREGLGSAFCFEFTYIIPIEFMAFYPLRLFLRAEGMSSLASFAPMIGIGLLV